MPVITRLKRTRGGSIAVHVDGDYWLTLPLRLIEEFQLREGAEIAPNAIPVIERATLRDGAYNKCLTLLTYRPRSEKELRELLLRSGFDVDSIESAVSKLKSFDLIDDAAFARRWIESRISGKGYGVNRIKQELRRRGIADEIIEAEIAFIGEEDEFERALAVARSKSERYREMRHETAARKLSNMLLYRGFDPSIVRKVVRSVLDRNDADGDDEDKTR